MLSTNVQCWSVAGMMFLAGTCEVFSAESVVYRFPGGTVTITPRDSGTAIPKPVPRALESAAPRIQPRSTAVTTSSKPSSPRLRVRPVSLQQEDAVTQPASASAELDPTPGQIVPARAVVEELPALQSEVGVAVLKVATEVATPATAAEAAPVVTPAPATSIAAPTPNPEGAVLPTLQPQPGVTPMGAMELPIITPHVSDATPEVKVIPSQTLQYRDVYFSIPFNRVEYNANPSYRHDATMEFLFNQMRPTVIQRGTTNVYQYDMNSGYGGGAGGYPYWPYYPFNYGLRIHSSR